MDVEQLETGVPLFRFRATSADEAQVESIKGSHFAYGLVNKEHVTIPLVDVNKVFGIDNSLITPEYFRQKVTYRTN